YLRTTEYYRIDHFDQKSDTDWEMKRIRQSKSDKVWENSQTANLVRYKPSGVYFVRARIGGKLIRKSLKTTVYSVAVLKLADETKEHRQLAELHSKAEQGKMTFESALAIYRSTLKADASIKPRTVDYYEERIAALLKSWPDLEKMDLRKLQPSNLPEWGARFRENRSATA